MTAPNLLSPSGILGKTTYLTLADTNETDLLVNASGSNSSMRVTNLMVANIDGTNVADISATLYTAAAANINLNSTGVGVVDNSSWNAMLKLICFCI